MKPPRLLVHSYGHSSTSKWVVEGWRENGKRKRKFFETEKEAQEWVKVKNTELTNFGISALTLSEDLRHEAIKAAQLLDPYGYSLSEAAAHFIRHLDSCARSCTINELISEFIQSRNDKGRGIRYVKDLRSRLERFRVAFGNKTTATLTSREIDLWIIGLGLGPQSQNNYRAVLSTLFSYAVRRGYASDHPVAEIEKVKVVAEPPGILSPDEVTSLLDASFNYQPDMIAYLTIGAFAGLRIAELDRLTWNRVDLQSGYIHVTAKSAKGARRRLVRIEQNLASWLTLAPQTGTHVRPMNCRKKLLHVREKSGLKHWPSNCLRHSYASYHLAQFQDAAALALQMGHRTTDMLFEHYREIVNHKKAELYWALLPPQGPLPAFLFSSLQAGNSHDKPVKLG